jgi:hypothetical protein
MRGERITPDELIEGAMRKTGLDDLGSPHFERFLDAWCAGLSSGRLSDQGRTFLGRQAARNLEMRLRVLDVIARNPEIKAVKLPPIVRIMGFPRSGTTLLHNLMSLHRDARALLRWELVQPLPPPEAATHATDPRIEQVNGALSALRGTELERMHWVEATDPEECTWGFYDLSGLMGRGVSYLMPEWIDAVVDPSATHRETYEEYRLLVKLLLWRNPLPANGILILKCPTDTDQIQTFLEVFPEAKLVLCHRDPFRTLTSNLRMQEVICGPLATSPDAIDLTDGRMVQTHVDFAESMVAAASASRDRIASVRYPDLMTDPTAVVVATFHELQVPVDAAQLEGAAEQLIAAQRSGRRATPPAKYDLHGYSPTDIHRAPSIAAYMEAFGVQSEDVRMTAPLA